MKDWRATAHRRVVDVGPVGPVGKGAVRLFCIGNEGLRAIN